ncbi:MAG: amino-acid N-acetyltransferase, partial [Spirochaetes bacterium]
MAASDIREQVDLIREVFAYTERFRGSTFVIRISNEIIDHPSFPQHARDLALLHNAGIRIVIVPGARKKIDEVLGRYEVEKHFVGDIRVSDPESMDLIKMAAFDVAHRVMTALSGHKITAVIGNWVRARSRGVLDGTDYGRTGLVDRVRVEAVVRSLEQGHVPIFPCVGHNDSGDPFNLSSDELAGTVAGSLNAKKLFLLSADPVMSTPDWQVPEGVDILEDGRIFRMTPAGVADFIKLNPEKPGLTAL